METYYGDSRDNETHKFVRTQHFQVSGPAGYGSKGSKSGKDGMHGGKGGKDGMHGDKGGAGGRKGVKGGHGSKGGKGSGLKGRNEPEG